MHVYIYMCSYIYMYKKRIHIYIYVCVFIYIYVYMYIFFTPMGSDTKEEASAGITHHMDTRMSVSSFPKLGVSATERLGNREARLPGVLGSVGPCFGAWRTIWRLMGLRNYFKLGL